MEKEPIVTIVAKEKLQKMKVGYESARDIFELAERRLDDCLQSMSNINGKILSMISGYMTILAGLMALGLAVWDAKNVQLIAFLKSFCPFLFTSIVLFLVALYNREYGAMGWDPKALLSKDYVGPNKRNRAFLFLYMSHDLQEMIDVSRKSNVGKQAYLNAGIYFSLFGVLTSLSFSFHLFSLCLLGWMVVWGLLLGLSIWLGYKY